MALDLTPLAAAGVTRANPAWGANTAGYSATTSPNDGVGLNTAGGAYASDGSIGYIPEVWAGKLIERWYNASVIAAITSTDYEGLIKSYGDTVQIRAEPLISVTDYEVGKPLTYGVPGENKVELNIDQAKAWAFTIDDVDAHQSDLNLMSVFADAASEQLKVVVDKEVLAMITQGADGGPANDGVNGNYGNAAGKISGDIRLGAPIATGGLVLDSSNKVVDMILAAGQCLDEQNAPETGRWIVLPAWAIQQLKTPENDGTNASAALVGANTMGDGVSILRNGKVGTIDRFTIYSSNQLPVVSQGTEVQTNIIAGVPSACAFASQIVKNETLPNPDSFGELMRGLQVYGYETIKPEGVVAILATPVAGV